jgi:hypothetical protein
MAKKKRETRRREGELLSRRTRYLATTGYSLLLPHPGVLERPEATGMRILEGSSRVKTAQRTCV